MRFTILMILLFVVQVSNAQTVRVLDRESREPVFNVVIYNGDQSVSRLTNFDGEADISGFSRSEPLYFKHVSHEMLRTTKSQILRNKGIVLLSPNETMLQEVVLSISGFEQEKKKVPKKVITISRKDILFSSPQTSADLLQQNGQVFVQKSQLGGGSPMIRGFATNRLLITVDGVRMNTAIFRGGNVQNIISIDPLSVAETEVILGPGSVIYGSDAIGGVMNFYTLRPQFSTGGTMVSGSAYTRYSSANQEMTGHVDLNVANQNWSWLSGVSYSDFDHLRMGSHGPEEYLRYEYAARREGKDITLANPDPLVQVPTAYSQLNLLEKVRYRPAEAWDLELSLIYSTTSDYPRYDRLYRKRDGQLAAAQWYYGPQQWLQTRFGIHNEEETRYYDQANLTASYQMFEESRHDRDYGQNIRYETEEHLDAWSINVDFEKDLGKHELFYGLEYLINTLISKGTETNIDLNTAVRGASRYPTGSSWQSLGAYGSLQWQLARDLTLQTGARYSFVALDAEFEEQWYDLPFEDARMRTGALTGSTGISWRQSRFLRWKLNFTTAFRAPNIDDVGKVFDSAPGLVVVPNPNLSPEYAYNGELIAALDFEGILMLNLAGYYTYLDDALVRRDFSLDGRTIIDYQGEPSRVQAIQNTARAYVYGFEAGMKVNFSPSVYFKGRMSIIEGEEEQDDGTQAPLRHASPFFGSAHLVWQNRTLKFDLFTDYNGEIPYEELAPSERDKPYLYALDKSGNPYAPRWYTLNFSASAKISEDLLATGALENLTDQRYRTYSSGIAAAGRNLILGLRYSF